MGEKAGLKPTENNYFSGNFTYEDHFDKATLDSRWMRLRNSEGFWKTGDGHLTLTLMPGNIYQREPLSAVWARQQHGTFTAETTLDFTPRNDKDIAGIALLQKEDHNIVFGKTLVGGKTMITLTRSERFTMPIASAYIGNGTLKLKVEAHDRYYDFFYAEGNGEWMILARGVDGSNLSTQKSGGFIGACIGLYASSDKDMKPKAKRPF